jgi:hypothetical protein
MRTAHHTSDKEPSAASPFLSNQPKNLFNPEKIYKRKRGIHSFFADDTGVLAKRRDLPLLLYRQLASHEYAAA